MRFTPSLFLPPNALFVRSTLSKKDLEATIASVMHDINPGVGTGSIDELSELRGERSLPHRRIIAMLSVFGGTAILLAALGLSVLLSDSVFRRRRELGIRATLGPVLKPLHEPIDNWLGSLPMSVAMACAIGLFAAAAIWVWCLKREFVFRGAPDRRWWRDLRIWATIVLLPYIGVYLLLGR